jgi:hypothetical protein
VSAHQTGDGANALPYPPLSMRYALRNLGHAPRLCDAKEPFGLAPIEADDDLAIDDRDWCGHIAELLEFFQSLRTPCDITVLEGDPFRGKKLLRPMAEHSSRLGLDDYTLLAHCGSLLFAFDPGAGADVPGVLGHYLPSQLRAPSAPPTCGLVMDVPLPRPEDGALPGTFGPSQRRRSHRRSHW